MYIYIEREIYTCICMCMYIYIYICMCVYPRCYLHQNAGDSIAPRKTEVLFGECHVLVMYYNFNLHNFKLRVPNPGTIA